MGEEILMPFTYPMTPHVRRHGPHGYKTYESYREWLRDEFSFRCVYCLARELWFNFRGIWDIDHVIPQAVDPSLTTVYENLVYSCRSCNSIKGDNIIADPCNIGFGTCLRVEEDGNILPLNEEGELLIETLTLNAEDYRGLRRRIILVVNEFTETQNQEALRAWFGFPSNLPDLSRLEPPGNTRPEGINNSYHALSNRNELSNTY
jgi:hypothetical protein